MRRVGIVGMCVYILWTRIIRMLDVGLLCEVVVMSLLWYICLLRASLPNNDIVMLLVCLVVCN